MTLEQLEAMLRQEFRPPFVSEGLVRTAMQSDGTLKLWIGPHDVHLDAEGQVLGAGTWAEPAQ